MVGRVGKFHSGYGGVRVPVGAYLLDAGSAAAASAIQALDGSTFDGSANAAKLAAWIVAGCPGAKDASFYSLTPSIANSMVNMSGYNTPSNWQVTEQNGYSTSTTNYGWKAFDDSDVSAFQINQTAVQGDGITLTKLDGDFVPFAFYEVGQAGNAPKYFEILLKKSGVIKERIFSYSYVTNALYPATINAIDTMQFKCYATLIGDMNVVMNSLLPIGADLSVIKCTHGLTTGAAVRVDSLLTLPTGLARGTTYYLREGADADKCTLYDTNAHAVAGGATGLIGITDPGSGTFKLFPYPTIQLSTVTNGKIYY